MFARFQRGFEAAFERFRNGYRDTLGRLAERRNIFVSLYLAVSVVSLSLLLFVGEDFFPGIKSGAMSLHVRFPAGTRIEETAKSAILVDGQIRALLPGHVTGTLANCGLPVSGINQAYSANGTIGTQDCDITISLDNQASPVATYRQVLRTGLPERVAGSSPLGSAATVGLRATPPPAGSTSRVTS